MLCAFYAKNKVKISAQAVKSGLNRGKIVPNELGLSN